MCSIPHLTGCDMMANLELNCVTYFNCVITQLAQSRESMLILTNGYSGLKRGNIGSN